MSEVISGTINQNNLISGSLNDVPTMAEFSELNDTVSGKLDSFKLLDKGIDSLSWSVVRSTITVKVVEDIYKQYRPTGTNTRYWAEFTGCPYFKNRQLYRVTFNGTVYDNLVCDYGILTNDGTGSVVGSDTTVGGAWQLIGNKNIYDSRYESTGEPFCIMYVEHGGMNTNGSYYYSSTVGNGILMAGSAGSYTLKIEQATIVQTDLPKSLFNNFGYGDRTYQNINNSTYPRTSLGQGNIVGRGSFAIGNSNISTGQFALTVGSHNKALGGGGVCEGRGNIVCSICGHAEGGNTKVYAPHGHAEGNGSLAFGQYAHAEGWDTIASGAVSHAEGCDSAANGNYSHAEGRSFSTGDLSHSQGNGTYATRKYQSVSGKYNVKENSSIGSPSVQSELFVTDGTTDTFSINTDIYIVNSFTKVYVRPRESSSYDTSYTYTATGNSVKLNKVPPSGSLVLVIFNGYGGSSEGTYAHIVGNGTSDTTRSNAYTLDWNGNGWYSGSVEAKYVIMKSQNGTRWKLTIDNDGSLITNKIDS